MWLRDLPTAWPSASWVYVELGQQPIIALGFVYRVEVLALQVLHQGDGGGLGVRHIVDQRGDLVQARGTGCPPAALAGDDLEAAGCHRVRSYQERLQDAAEPDRLGKLLQSGRVDAATGLVGVWLQQVERHVADARSLRRCLDSGIAQQRG